MCAIAGFYGFRDDSKIKRMSQILKHRGPDGEGYYIDENVSLLNRRLAIIDRSTGNQPIFNEEKTLVTVFNGEIYNYRSLTTDLKKDGHRFISKSDTETIVHGYEKWGLGLFNRLNGMFAIALFNKQKNELILARDHFGIKPLYYAILGSHLVFASEIKAILETRIVEKEPNDKVIYRYLKYRVHDDSRETFFKNIFRLLPGELLIRKKNKLVIKKYSTLENDLLKLPEEKFDPNKFRRSFFEAVNIRLVSEVPVGTCLSGGIDSSSVASVVSSLIKKNTVESKSIGKRQNTFSAVFPGAVNDEEKYIDKVVENIGSKEHKVIPQADVFFSEIDDFVRTQEEPTISTGPYAQYKVMEMAKKHVVVVLDGQGSDEMMAGYLPYYFVYLRQLYSQKKYLTLFKEIAGSTDILKKYLTGRSEKKINPDKLMSESLRKKYFRERFFVENRHLKKRLVQDIFSNSLQSLLRYEDKNAMRFSIEGRVPFLDLNLIKTVFSMPDSSVIKDGWNKYLLRSAVSGIVPESVRLRRNKIGFTTPEVEWMRKISDRIFSVFSSSSFGKRKYFDQKEVLIAFKEFVDKKNSDSMLFWRFLNIEIWLRIFFDNDSVENQEKQKPFLPNKGKKIAVTVENKKYYRYPVKTALFSKNDNYPEKIADEVVSFIEKTGFNGRNFFVVVSEKIVAISQGQSRFIWDIKPGLLATLLSRFVKKSPHGIGLGSPWTMQMALDEAGTLKILLASFVSAATKVIGLGGMFYKIAGDTVRSIDGPTPYSLFPSNVSAKLGPANPKKSNQKISLAIGKKLKNSFFKGSVLIDANDIGINILDNQTPLKNKLIEKIMKDNPSGQESQQTPIVICLYN